MLTILTGFSLFAKTNLTTSLTASSKSKTAKLPPGVVAWTVDAQRAKCEGATTMQCLLVKEQGKKEFELFYDKIDGFEYQEGFVYVIWVKQVPKTPPVPVNVSVYNYVLVKVVSKKSTAGYSNTTEDVKKPLSGLTVSSTKTLVVNEEKATCSGIAENKCLLIKEPGKKEFELFYQDIEGFVFEPGYRQTILVSERYIPNAMVKEAQPVYSLIKVISKVAVNVENPAVNTPVSNTTQAKTPLDKKWILRKMKDSDTTSYIIGDNAVWIEFNSGESRYTGNGPCNNYFGGFKSNLISSFQASVVASSKVYCSNMSLEELFFSLLQNADRYEIKDGKLILSKGERLLLVFEQ